MRSLKAGLVVLAVGVVACGGGKGGGVTAPDVPVASQAPVSAPLAVPARLRAVWAPASRAGGAVARLGANAVILQPESWADDLAGYAAWSRGAGVGAIPYVGQCFEGPRGGWDGCWASVERWAKPLRDAGILWGFQGLDEPAHHGLVAGGERDAAIAYIRARGFDALAVEWIEYVTDRAGARALARPPGVRWYGVTCYAYQSRTPWHVENCAAEYARHPDWDLVVVPDREDLNRATGYPYSRAEWEAIAGSTRSIAFWGPESGD